MSTFDDYQANPASVPPLTRAVCDGFPRDTAGFVHGPTLGDTAFRALLDALAAMEQKQISHGW